MASVSNSERGRSSVSERWRNKRSILVGILVESSTGGSSVCGGRPRLGLEPGCITHNYICVNCLCDLACAVSRHHSMSVVCLEGNADAAHRRIDTDARNTSHMLR
jgi:hypothetical protein